ncbi:NAD(+) synthase [Salimicrobium flavidum]|uniref:NH(3)-dependent NAD(+) synthetase n=1 Tax=Salimicrobium flavidum TaxID=570947 RepID=A0A1N7ISV0_9BACI|nr:NAD(+) synthase [Salimicrobium flavidum]SIS40162.1 NH(3)-dependent NAD(+) synthetase [Salimicrobium flavidum]
MREHVDYLVEWLEKRVKDAGAKGAVVGVSGGLDSAVVANLIKRAFPNDSLGVIMPVGQQVEDQVEAVDTVEKADLFYIGINLTDAYQKLFKDIKESIETHGEWVEDNELLGGANLKARLRMNALYAMAANYNYLVVGTGNAPETYTGYFTKFGDGAADLEPLAHLTKEQVREMARFLEVPEAVIERPPSAELWEGQTDEGELGVSYDTIDAYLRGESIDEKDKQIIEELHEKSKHKRQMPAVPQEFPKGE